MDKLMQEENRKVQQEKVVGENQMGAIEFEREIYLMLVDCLYGTKGKFIYSIIQENSTEFHFVQNFFISYNQTSRVKVQKVFNLSFPDQNCDPNSLYDGRLFIKLTSAQAKTFLLERKVSSGVTMIKDT